MKLNKAFTMSEVLITLVIIGVIGAITVPNIIANHRRTEASAKIKNFIQCCVMHQPEQKLTVKTGNTGLN